MPTKRAATSEVDPSYATTKRVLKLFVAALNGEELSIERIENECGVQRAAAGRYRKLVNEQLPLVEATRRGRTVLHRETEEQEMILQAFLLELANGALPWLEGTTHLKHLAPLKAKLRARLDDAARTRLDQLSASVCFKNHPAPLRSPRAPIVDRLLQAIRSHRRCTIEYETLEGETRSYSIEPWSIMVCHGSVACVVGRKLPTGEVRTFEIAGIEALQVSEQVFVTPAPSESNVAELLRDTIGTYESRIAAIEDVVLEARGAAAVRLRRRPLHPSQQCVEPKGGWRRFHLRVAICPELKSTLRGMLPDVRVVAPMTLRETLGSHGPR